MTKDRLTFNPPPEVPFEETQRKLDEIHKLKQEVNQELSHLTDKVELNVDFKPPFRVIPISDTHLFSPQTDLNKVNEMFAKLDDPNTYAYIMGDVIEGFHPRISDHGGNLELDFGKQIEAAKRKLKPYVESGKILFMSSTYNGHEGWGSKVLGIDVVELLARDFKQPDGTPLQILVNGGLVVLNLSNGERHSEIIYHAPGGGGSDEINPLGAQRGRLREYIKHEGQVDGVGGGDWHHRAGVSKEITFDLQSGLEESHVLFANGTTKGNDRKNMDPFLTRMAKGPTTGPGVQLILNQPKTEKKSKDKDGRFVWASYGYDKGEVLYEAAKLWNAAERGNHTSGMVEEIISHSRKPKAEFDRANSRTKVKENRFQTPMFEKFNWKVESSNNLPILVYLLQNARYGSTSFEHRDREKLLGVYKHAAKSPFEYALIMRHFVNSDVYSDYHRRDVLKEMLDDLRPLVNQNSILGFMMSSSLLDARWEKDALGESIWVPDDSKRGGHWERERDPGFRPGDEIYAGLDRKSPLYLNQSLMNIKYGNVNHEFLLLDHLSRSGSEFDMFRGLVQARNKAELRSDIVTGGHMLGAGYAVTPEATYISPGWFSDYDSGNKANMRRAPLGGQGVILFPDKKMVIPASTFLEATDLHSALMLQRGMGKKEKEKILYKSSK